MAKQKTVFYCQSCGTESAKWVGKCPSCNEWNTYVEEVVSKGGKEPLSFTAEKSKPINILDTADNSPQGRISSGISELDRVLGGGIVDGSLVLVGGEPGIGKSTLMLQMAVKLKQKVLYISGEESVEQIKMRADRIGTTAENCFLYAETSLSAVLSQSESMDPDIVIIDSIQTLHSDRIEASIG
ncbi:MAG: ATPase domain-containing protein, partial [Ekhidna sp.]